MATKEENTTIILELVRELLGEHLYTDFLRARIQTIELIKKIEGDPIRLLPEPPLIRKLYRSWPGIGKTETITRLAEEAGKEFPTLVLGLSHKAFDNVEWPCWTAVVKSVTLIGEFHKLNVVHDFSYLAGVLVAEYPACLIVCLKK